MIWNTRRKDTERLQLEPASIKRGFGSIISLKLSGNRSMNLIHTYHKRHRLHLASIPRDSRTLRWSLYLQHDAVPRCSPPGTVR